MSLLKSPLKTKCLTYSWANGAALSNVAITGAGFKPKAALIIMFPVGAATTTYPPGIDFVDEALLTKGVYNITGTSQVATSLIAGNVTAYEEVTVVSFDADGLTINGSNNDTGVAIVFQILVFG